jgi:hypothetical protein
VRRSRPLRRGRLGGKKEAHCEVDEKAPGWGDGWDHDIIEVASRAGIVRGHGPRTAETGQRAMLELQDRLVPGHGPGLVTTAEPSPDVAALLAVFGQRYTPARQPGPGAPKKAVLVPAPELVDAQVDNHRSAPGRVAEIEPRRVFGTPEQLPQRLEASPASTHGNTAVSERANGCDRHRNPRKARKVLSFSKQGAEHRAVAWLVMGLSLCCWVPRTLRRTPAMILGKTTHALTVGEFLRRRPTGFHPPRLADIRAGPTLFHDPEVSPERLAQWPDKRLVQRSFQHLGVNARGLG